MLLRTDKIRERLTGVAGPDSSGAVIEGVTGRWIIYSSLVKEGVDKIKSNIFVIDSR